MSNTNGLSRTTAVAGTFYPDSKSEVLRYINHFNQNLETYLESLKSETMQIKPKALIVPHAGYIYSGFTANVAYALAKKHTYKRVLVIGPSHRVYVQGASIAHFDSYETPLGNIPMDKKFAQELQAQFSFLQFNANAHQEHSTETQAPFIKHYFKDASIVEIVYGQQEEKSLSTLIDYCIESEDTLVVISTDLSHFYTLQQANYLDNICLKAIQDKQPSLLDEGCEACGMIGVKALLQSAIQKDLKMQLLHYTTSFEYSRDDTSVVGYCSFVIGE